MVHWSFGEGAELNPLAAEAEKEEEEDAFAFTTEGGKGWENATLCTPAAPAEEEEEVEAVAAELAPAAPTPPPIPEALEEEVGGRRDRPLGKESGRGEKEVVPLTGGTHLVDLTTSRRFLSCREVSPGGPIGGGSG